MAAIINQRSGLSAFSENVKPELIQKIDGQVARVIALRILIKEEGYLTISEDKTLRVILKRDTGQFWPSSIEYLPSVPSSLCFHEESSSIFVGLITGVVLHYSIAEDMNKLEMTRRFQNHTHTVSGVIFSPTAKQLFTCSRDKCDLAIN